MGHEHRPKVDQEGPLRPKRHTKVRLLTSAFLGWDFGTEKVTDHVQVDGRGVARKVRDLDVDFDIGYAILTRRDST